ncbi:dienelactone hydrolase family protein [Rhizobium sp. FY34]|uniref:dienelactone hydrolase family protein n=1 Tax=Rhizobium sp. FY34 TaxID=2562309 RepID=UPI0010C081C8|nr:dienelactone hydrolase family protein [Rhizobium sp. FY34]
MTVQIRDHSYSDDGTTFHSKLVYDDAAAQPGPAVIVAPAFGGLGPFEIERATELAHLGYVVLAIDYYGEGRRATSESQAFTWMNELNSDRPRLSQRMQRALQEIKSLPMVDPKRVAAMGYCFGGKAVLDLARSGADFNAAISFHGVYDAAQGESTQIQPSILILHGWDDPLAKPDDLAGLASELSKHCSDWQVVGFGGTGHAFTNPNARSPEAGMAYNEAASRRSWTYLLNFLTERL